MPNNNFTNICFTKGPTQQHSYRLQQRQQSCVNQLTSKPLDPNNSNDEHLHVYVLNHDTCGSKILTMSTMISEIPVDMIINTGASVDILDEGISLSYTTVEKSLSNI